MGARCRIRRAALADLTAIAEIESRSFSDPWSRDTLAGLLEAPEIVFLVAVAARAIAGYVIGLTASDRGEIQNIAVAPRRRRSGVGAALVQAILCELAQREARQVFLEVRASNRPAQRLYQSLGFRPIGRWKGYYQAPAEDAMILSKGIDTNRVSLVDKTT